MKLKKKKKKVRENTSDLKLKRFVFRYRLRHATICYAWFHRHCVYLSIVCAVSQKVSPHFHNGCVYIYVCVCAFFLFKYNGIITTVASFYHSTSILLQNTFNEKRDFNKQKNYPLCAERRKKKKYWNPNAKNMNKSKKVTDKK